MTERGTTGAGELQISGVPRLHQRPKQVHSTHGRGTIAKGMLLGRTMCRHSKGPSLTSRAMIHGSMVPDGVK